MRYSTMAVSRSFRAKCELLRARRFPILAFFSERPLEMGVSGGEYPRTSPGRIFHREMFEFLDFLAFGRAHFMGGEKRPFFKSANIVPPASPPMGSSHFSLEGQRSPEVPKDGHFPEKKLKPC